MVAAFTAWLIGATGGATDPLLDWLSRAGGTGALVLVLVLLIRGDLVTRGNHQDVVRQRDRALDLLYSQVDIAQDAVDISKRRLEIDEEVLQLRQRERP